MTKQEAQCEILEMIDSLSKMYNNGKKARTPEEVEALFALVEGEV